MKTVGKQLQEARLARNWTPELAARETKIKVDRLRDLEADDYTHFSSPTYARGFLRTYARALGLDEYKLLRQLDNKLPDDDNSSFVPDSGLPYIPEPHSDAHITSNKTGLYVVLGLGAAVMFIISFVMLQAYRSGELQHIFADNTAPDTLVSAVSPATNTAPAKPDAPSETRALPADPNAPVPPAVDAPPTNSIATTDTNAASAVAAATGETNADVPPQSVRALPVDPNALTNAPTLTAVAANPDGDTNAKPAPRALPVDLNAVNNSPNAGAIPAIPVAPVSSPVAPKAPAPTTAHDAASLAAAATSSKGTATSPLSTHTSATTNGVPQTPNAPTSEKHLILTASRDSFVRVTAVDAPDLEQVRYASVLHAGQSIGFDGRKFSVNVGIPSAVDITLDGVNYGPHSDQEAPETFTVESRHP